MGAAMMIPPETPIEWPTPPDYDKWAANWEKAFSQKGISMKTDAEIITELHLAMSAAVDQAEKSLRAKRDKEDALDAARREGHMVSDTQQAVSGHWAESVLADKQAVQDAATHAARSAGVNRRNPLKQHPVVGVGRRSTDPKPAVLPVWPDRRTAVDDPAKMNRRSFLNRRAGYSLGGRRTAYGRRAGDALTAWSGFLQVASRHD